MQESINQGATCLMGGEIPEGAGWFYPITILRDVSSSMPVFREETFGPVFVICKANDNQHAIELANDTDYGLAASVWTTSAEGRELANQIYAGQIVINGVVKTDPRLPSGGSKRSGYGRVKLQARMASKSLCMRV